MKKASAEHGLMSENNPETREMHESPTRRFTFVTRDRGNWLGKTELNFDSRSTNIHIDYLTEAHNDPKINDDYFYDDHIRSINNNLTRADRRKTGGRDDRDFYIPRTEEMEQEFQTLLNQLNEMRESIKELYGKMQPLFKPERVEPKIHQYSQSYKVENESGNLKSDVETTYYIGWVVSDVNRVGTSVLLEERVPKEITNGLYGTGKAKSVNKYFATILEADTPKNVQEELEQFEEKYFNKKDEIGLTALETRFEELKTKIGEFEKVQNLDVSLHIYAPNTPEHKNLSKLLGDERSLFIKDKRLDIGDSERLDAEKLEQDTVKVQRRLQEEQKKKQLEQIRSKEAENTASAKLEKDQRQIDEEAVSKLEEQQLRAKIEAELTPEIREQIESKLVDLQSYIGILRKIPNTSAECIKFVNSLPIGVASQLKLSYENNKKGIDLLDDIKKQKEALKQFADRTRINAVLPNLKNRSLEILENWQKLKTIISSDDAAQMILDDGLITHEELLARTSELFLSDPWNSSPEQVIDSIVESIVESADL
ncbi:MAG: hypothetical protein Q8P30_01275 [Candidatus Uhrbacteria bacterium]|nr:hypothetical protein [Candidatus Uhrbacteria bacterium]